MRRLVRSRVRLLAYIVVVIGIAVAIITSTPYMLNLSHFFSSILTINGGILILAAITLQVIGHIIRAKKHSILLDEVRPTKLIEVFKGQTIGALFNAILPLRIGELVRAHYVAKGVTISRSAVFATIVLERTVDMGAIIGGALLISPVLPTDAQPVVRNIALFLGVGLIILSYLLYSFRNQKGWVIRLTYYVSSLFNSSVRDRMRMIIWSSTYMLKHSLNKRTVTPYFALSALMWLAYFSSTLLICFVLLDDQSLVAQVSSAFATYLGVSIPAGPANLGAFQEIFTAVSSLSSEYLHSNNITFALWALQIIPMGLLGLYWLVKPQIIYANHTDDPRSSVLKNKLFRDADITKEFSQFLDSYFHGSEINKILTSEELKGSFNTIKTFKGGSNALTLLAWQNDSMVVKKITLPEYADKLKDQFAWLHERSQYPEVATPLAELETSSYYTLDIEYKESYIPFFDYIHSTSTQRSVSILVDVLTFMNKCVYRSDKPVEHKRATRMLNEYIKSKAIGKIADAASLNTKISSLLSYDTVVINGQEYDNFGVIIRKIQKSHRMHSDLTDVLSSPIHGDLTIDNLIVDPSTDSFILLDPNNENAISDPVVDYGKLFQSLHSGYEFLYNMSDCQVTLNQINFHEVKSVQYDALYEELQLFLRQNLNENRYRSILFHEAIHYCRMLTYRCAINQDTAPAFYAIAVRLLNEYAKQYVNSEK